MPLSIRRALAALIVVAIFGGVSASAAGANTDPSLSLRTQVDLMGTRYFAAKNAARVIDDKLRSLDRELAITEHRVAALQPMAKATAVQLYQGSAQGFTALFDVASAMESARRAELITRAGERTQALLEKYAAAADRLERQRAELNRARARQARIVAGLAKQESALEALLARTQQAYRAQLAAQARADAAARQNAARQSSSAPAAPTATPPAPPKPIQVRPPAPPETGANPHHDDPFLVCTRTRESAGDYTAVNLAGYYGAYQFSQPTWDLTANHAGRPQLIGVRPDTASPWYQDELAWVLYQWQGKGPWLGLC